MPKDKRERVCLACRAGDCSKHVPEDMAGHTEAECSLRLIELGFDIVPKNSKRKITVKEMQDIVARQSIDAHGYVTNRRVK